MSSIEKPRISAGSVVYKTSGDSLHDDEWRLSRVAHDLVLTGGGVRAVFVLLTALLIFTVARTAGPHIH